MNFLSLLGMGGGGGGGGVSASSNSSGTSAGSGGGSNGLSSHDVLWIGVAFAGALALIGIVFLITKD